MAKLHKIKKITSLSYPQFGGFIIGAAGIFLAIAFISFHATDHSCFYQSSMEADYRNWAGRYGAYSASLVFFLLGDAAFLIIPFLFFLAWLFIAKRSYFPEIDRIGAYIVLIIFSAMFLTKHRIVLFTTLFPGGLVGLKTISYALRLFDPLLVDVIGITLLFTSLVVITRLSMVYSALFLLQIIIFIIPYKRLENALNCSISLLYGKLQRLIRQIHATIKGEPQVFYTSYGTLEKIIQAELEAIEDDETFWQAYGKQESASFLPKNPHGVSDQAQLNGIKLEQAEIISTQREPNLYALPQLEKIFNNNESQNEHQLLKESNESNVLAKILEEKLKRFGVQGKVVSINSGPVITLFEYEPHIDSKISKIIALEDDLTLALKALSIRIIAPIPGRSVVGFEVANKQRKPVFLANILRSRSFKNFSGALPLVLGENVVGDTVIVDLASMPHLLVAGSTGSGKSVGLNSMLISLLCKVKPQELKVILIDPKRLEFSSYADIPHLLFPIVTDPKAVAPILQWVVHTMEQRYTHMARKNVRNIFDYQKLAHKDPEITAMPFIVVIIDELSDLMMTAGKDIEDLIARIAQMARAAGIHMILATQRPSVDVITGLIKVNFPSRIAFKVISKIDSRTILDCNGADKLLGKGDMLFLDSGSSLRRVHGAYVNDSEIITIVNYIKSQQMVEYIDLKDEFSSSNLSDPDDHLYKDIVAFISDIDEISISLLQRKFKIGYNRSARIIDMLEARGLIFSSQGGKMRKVIRS